MGATTNLGSVPGLSSIVFLSIVLRPLPTNLIFRLPLSAFIHLSSYISHPSSLLRGWLIFSLILYPSSAGG